MKKLTQAEERVIQAMRTYKNEHGYMPAVRELCDMLNISSTPTINKHMVSLFEKGYIESEHRGCPRAYRLKEAVTDVT